MAAIDSALSMSAGDQVSVFGQIAVGALIGYAVGWEREFRGSGAGNRTFSIVAIGAASFTALGVEFFPASAEKVIAGIITGIGFLGAGLIWKGENGVAGLTTAASLWAAAGAATIAGAGAYWLALFACGLILLMLEIEHIPWLNRLQIIRHAPRESDHDPG